MTLPFRLLSLLLFECSKFIKIFNDNTMTNLSLVLSSYYFFLGNHLLYNATLLQWQWKDLNAYSVCNDYFSKKNVSTEKWFV